jgi:hypothetical protein
MRYQAALRPVAIEQFTPFGKCGSSRRLPLSPACRRDRAGSVLVTGLVQQRDEVVEQLQVLSRHFYK